MEQRNRDFGPGPLRPPGRRRRRHRRGIGKVNEALEGVKRARGRLYDFHQLIGRADFLFESRPTRWNYYATITEVESAVRGEPMAGRRHVYESELKNRRRTKQRPGHKRRPHEPAAGTRPA